MDRDRTRVLLLAFVSIGSIIAGTLIADWFVARITGMPEGLRGFGIKEITIDLREARACDVNGVCGSFPISKLRAAGFYPALAQISFWGGLGYGALIAYQCGSRVLAGFGNEAISKSGYGIGTLLFMMAVGAAYLFGPETGSEKSIGIAVVVEHGWGATALLFGYVSGMFALYYASRSSSGLDDASLKPLDPPVPVAYARTITPQRERIPSQPIERIKTPSQPVPRIVTPSQAMPRIGSQPIPVIPTGLKGKLHFTTTTAELTRAGIDARREDGHTVLVLWRDVVGVVARRLPPDLGDGVTFVDVVSTAGSTLRLLPWTRLIGETVEGEGPARARALVQLVLARCADAHLDPATRGFLDDASKQAAQLPDAATLAAHDARLA